MSEEEKKAIDELYHLAHINTYLDLQVEKDVKINIETIKKWKNATTIVLNLIEKQNKEIDIVKTNYEILQGEVDRIGIDTLKLEKGSSTDDVIEEIEIKDKMIDEMAEMFLTMAKDRPGTIYHYLEKDGFSTKDCSPCNKQKKDKEWTCAECFKEYFRKKAEHE